MPELPEVRNVVMNLQKVIINHKINNVIINLPKLLKNVSDKNFKNTIIGTSFVRVENEGKFIVLKLSDGKIIISHLRMEGKYRFQKEASFKKHDHIIFELDHGYLIYSDTRQFGTFHLFNESDYLSKSPISKLGNEPLKVRIGELFKKFERKHIPIKSSLLDQRYVVGLGNIYVNEVLWHEKIKPTRPTNEITKSELIKILATSDKIMEESTKMGGTTIHSFSAFDNKTGNYQSQLKVHRQKICARCKGKISKIKVGGRGTYFCPSCQKN